MARRSWDGVPAQLPALVAAGRALALAGGLAVLGVAGVAAQATPEGGIVASPAAGPCEAPEGTAEMAGMAASPMASPVGEEEGAEPIGTPVADDLADEVVAAAENFVNCWNEGNVEAVVALGTPNFTRVQHGVEAAEEAVAQLEAEGSLPPITILSTGDVSSYDDGRLSLDVEYLLGDHQYTSARLFMVEADGQLLLDEQDLQLPQPDVEASNVVGAGLADDESALALVGADEATGALSATLLPAVMLNVTNDGTEPRIVSVVRLADDMAGTPAAGPMPTDGEFVARVSVPAGDQIVVALLNLEPGSFAVGEVGGESVPLTITEPAA